MSQCVLAARCSVLKCVAVRCSVLQYDALCCSVPFMMKSIRLLQHTSTHCNILQRTLQTHCKHNATHCYTLQHAITHHNTLQHSATRCNTLQHAATRCNTLQHSATLCNTQQHTNFENICHNSLQSDRKSRDCMQSTRRWVWRFEF